jgi:DNA-binding transcriptional MerR regulator
MTTHEVEEMLDITKKTLIYYENEGLVKPLRDNNYRCYNQDDVSKIKFILLLREMDVTIEEIKQIINKKKSIRDVLENKKDLIKQRQLDLDHIDEKINNYIKRKKVKIAVDNVLDYGTIYDRLYFYKDFLQYFQTEIKYSDVKYFKLSMSSSIGYMKFMEVHMNYYVDLDVITQYDTYSFQIMNNEVVYQMMERIKAYPLEDPLGLVDIYLNKRDMVQLNQYINRHFRKWAKEYHLDNPREDITQKLKSNMFLKSKWVKYNDKIKMHIKCVLSLVMIVHMFTFRDSL